MKRVLIIDDDQYIRDLYQEVLTEAQFNVTTAIDGEEGLAKAREGGFDLILLDAMMPKVDGLGVLKGLKEEPPKAANGPILLLTNLAHDTVINQALQEGAKTYFVKSEMNPDEFLDNIKKFLG